METVFYKMGCERAFVVFLKNAGVRVPVEHEQTYQHQAEPVSISDTQLSARGVPACWDEHDRRMGTINQLHPAEDEHR